MVLMLETPVKVPFFHSPYRQNLISTPLEENDVDAFLLNIYAHTDSNFFPSPKHIHVLFHLATSPRIGNYATEQINPIALLDRMLTLRPASVFKVYMPKPGDPVDRWKYECTGGSIERDARRRIRRCGQDGIFGLLWDDDRTRAEEREKKRRRRGEDEDEAGGEGMKVVAAGAWEMVHFLVRLWKQDQAEYRKAFPDQPALSPLFLDQFRSVPKKAGDMQLDRLDHPLSILRSIYSAGKTPARNKTILIGDIVSLIVPLLEGTHPIFHPPSFSISILPFLRTLSATSLDHFFTLLVTRAPLSVVAHLMSVLLEDLGGTRIAKAQMRRERARESAHNMEENSGAHLEIEKGRWAAGLAPPSVPYFVEGLLPLSPMRRDERDEAGGESKRKAGCLKLRLLDTLLEDGLYPVAADDQWGVLSRQDDSWAKKVEVSVDGRYWKTIQIYLEQLKGEVYKLAGWPPSSHRTR